jgi:hypothetical protein
MRDWLKLASNVLNGHGQQNQYCADCGNGESIQDLLFGRKFHAACYRGCSRVRAISRARSCRQQNKGRRCHVELTFDLSRGRIRP